MRVDIQRSVFPRVPRLPGRLEVKMSVRPSRERVGWESTKAVSIGDPRCSGGVDQFSCLFFRVNRQMSKPPDVPSRFARCIDRPALTRIHARAAN